MWKYLSYPWWKAIFENKGFFFSFWSQTWLPRTPRQEYEVPPKEFHCSIFHSFCNACLHLLLYPVPFNACKYMCRTLVFLKVLCVSGDFNFFFMCYIAIVLPVLSMHVNEQTLMIVEGLSICKYNNQVVFNF